MDKHYSTNLPTPTKMSLEIMFSLFMIHFSWTEEIMSNSYMVKDLALVQLCNHSNFIMWRMYIFYKSILKQYTDKNDSRDLIQEKLQAKLLQNKKQHFILEIDMIKLGIPYDYLQFLLNLPYGIQNALGYISENSILYTFQILTMLDYPELGLLQIFDYFEDYDINSWCNLFNIAYDLNYILFCQYICSIKLKVPFDVKMLPTHQFQMPKLIHSVKSFINITNKHLVYNCSLYSCSICQRRDTIGSIFEQFRTIRRYSIKQRNIDENETLCMCWSCNPQIHQNFDPVQLFQKNLIIQPPPIYDRPPPCTPDVILQYYQWFIFRPVSDIYGNPPKYNFTLIARTYGFSSHQDIIDIFHAKTDKDFWTLRTWHNGIRNPKYA